MIFALPHIIIVGGFRPIVPGVPALRAGENLVIALKSGNFGGPDYFEKAAEILGENQ